jgi:hypothetical protein
MSGKLLRESHMKMKIYVTVKYRQKYSNDQSGIKFSQILNHRLLFKFFSS